MKLGLQLLLIFGWWIACVSLAEAHAFVDHAEPSVGGTVHSPVQVVKIWFTRKIDPKQSTIQVFDAKGGEVDQRSVKVDSSDATLMSVSVPKLSTGTYKVVWKAVCLDTHTTRGTFTFKVAGGA